MSDSYFFAAIKDGQAEGFPFASNVQLSLAQAQAASLTAPSLALAASIPVSVPAASGTIAIQMPCGFLLTGVTAVKLGATGGSGDTVTVKKGSNTIVSFNLNTVTAKSLGAANTLDTAYTQFAAGDTLNVVAANSTDCSCLLAISGVKL